MNGVTRAQIAAACPWKEVCNEIYSKAVHELLEMLSIQKRFRQGVADLILFLELI